MPVPTQGVDEQFIQLVCEQRLWEAVEVIRHRLKDIPLKPRISRLLTVVLWP